MLLRAVHFFLQSREVGELEIALSFPFLQMSWNRRSWKYLTGDLPRPAQPFREGHDAPPGDLFLGGRFFRISFFVEESRSGRGEREQSFGPLSLSSS